jgi:trimeric autotransporter adhesin
MKGTILSIFSILLVIAAQAQIITTVAGGGTSGLGDGGAATDCQLNQPVGVVLDPVGNLYIADRNNNRIRKVSTSGVVTTIAGTGVAGYTGDGGLAIFAKLNNPYGIALDASGNIYFSEQLNYCIRKIDAFGVISTIAGNGTAGYSGDNALATDAQISGAGFIVIDPAGNIYFPEFDNHCVRKVNASGIITTIAGGSGPGNTGDGGSATSAKLYHPIGLARDISGNMYVADYGNHRIRKINAAGYINTIAGTGISGYNGENVSATNALLNSPISIAIDNSGALYVGETDNYRVRKINTESVIATIAGTGINGSSGDGGSAISATFQTITGICLDLPGNIYISDIGTKTIRRIIAPANVSTTKQNLKSIQIYPVPNKGVFTMNVLSPISEHVKLVILNSFGEVVKQFSILSNIPESIQLDVPSGMYTISAIMKEAVVYEKIVVLR